MSGRLTLDIHITDTDGGRETKIHFDTQTQRTDVTGPLYPAEIDMLHHMVSQVREANKFHQRKAGQ